MHREITLLCPVCQTTRHVAVDINATDNIDGDTFVPYTGIQGKCPHCETKMYQADEDLIDALKMLNSAGYATQFHCSGAHDDSDVGEHNYTDYFTRDMFTRGPHIIIDAMTEEQIKTVFDVGRSYTAHYTDETEMQLEIEHMLHVSKKLLGRDVTRESRIELSVMCTRIGTADMKDACKILTDFVEKWLRSTNNGELPTGNGVALRRIANTCWFK